MQLYTSCCESVLALPPGPVQRQRHSLVEGSIHQVLNSPLAWGYPGFHLSLQNCRKPTPRLSTESVGQWAEWRRLLVVKSYIWTVHLSTGHWRHIQAICQGAMILLSSGQSSSPDTHQDLRPGVWSLFLLLCPGSRCKNHIFVLPVTN